jgi:hypothetical protein
MPIGFGEPHYAQMIAVDGWRTWDGLPDRTPTPSPWQVSPVTAPGEERIEETATPSTST